MTSVKASKTTWYKYFSESWDSFTDTITNKSRKVLKNYFENSSINCYQYVVDDTMQKWERWMWRVVHVMALFSAIWVMWIAGGGAILNPVAISRTPIEAPLNQVPFPAVAVCARNRISKIRVTELAKSIIEEKSLNFTLVEVLYYMEYLGLAYELELPNSDELEILHNILEPYNLNLLLRKLTPTCNEMIERCIWRNKLVNCSKYFIFRKTLDGFCCTFNYLRPSDFFGNHSNKIAQNNTKKMSLPGELRGLSLLLNPKLEDYFFTKLPHAGFKILIYSSEEYPDIGSGGCFQAPLSPQTELYIDLNAILVTGTPEIRKLPFETRGCHYDTDNDAYMSQSDCIVDCRISSIRAACNCVPFFYPLKSGDVVCSLIDNICLQRWKQNWMNAWSGEEIFLKPGEEAGDPQEPPCSFCHPECEETTYKSRQHAIFLQPDNVNLQEDEDKASLKKGVVFKDHSVVHIFFSKDTVLHLTHGILSNWYDLLCSMGGICGLVLGASVISAVEIMYYFCGGPVIKSHRKHTEMRQLYWKELQQRRNESSVLTFYIK